MIWAQETYGYPNTVLLVFCDEKYQESDYLHDFEEFSNAISSSDVSI